MVTHHTASTSWPNGPTWGTTVYWPAGSTPARVTGAAAPRRARGTERMWQMTCTLHVAWDERLTDYHFGPGHPLAPMRLELTMQLAHEFGLWTRPGVTVAAPDPATGADLELVHDARYIAAVRTVSGWAEDLGARGLEAAQFRYARTFGLGTWDQPVFPRMHQASALVAGATLAVAGRAPRPSQIRI